MRRIPDRPNAQRPPLHHPSLKVYWRGNAIARRAQEAKARSQGRRSAERHPRNPRALRPCDPVSQSRPPDLPCYMGIAVAIRPRRRLVMAISESYFSTPLPDGLKDLSELALDLGVTSYPGAREFWRMIDPEVWGGTRNPWLLLQTVDERRLEEV